MYLKKIVPPISMITEHIEVLFSVYISEENAVMEEWYYPRKDPKRRRKAKSSKKKKDKDKWHIILSVSQQNEVKTVPKVERT